MAFNEGTVVGLFLCYVLSVAIVAGAVVITATVVGVTYSWLKLLYAPRRRWVSFRPLSK